MRETKVKTAKGAMLPVTVFDSSTELALEVKKAHEAGYLYADNTYSSWAGGSYVDCIKGLQRGDKSLVKKAQAMIEAITVPVTRRKRKRIKVVDGPSVDLAKAYDGIDRCCVMVKKKPDARAAVNVLFDTGISGGISHETIMRRGCAALALVMALEKVRPVNLWIATGANAGDNRAMLYKMDTGPIDLARACWMLTSPMMERITVFCSMWNRSGASANHGSVLWCYDHEYQQDQLLTDLSQLTEGEAIKLSGHHLYDGDFESDGAAKAWVHRKFEQYKGEVT